MEASKLFPDGFSIFYPELTPMLSEYATVHTRSAIGPVRYYLDGFGYARHYCPYGAGPQTVEVIEGFEEDIQTLKHVLGDLIKVRETFHCRICRVLSDDS
jgi:hypothetical protein